MTLDPTVIAAAIVTVLTAFGVLVVTIINAKSSADERKDARLSRAKIEEIAAATNGKADTIIEKTVEIHALTNSNLSRVTTALDVATAKIEGLQKLVASMTEAKKVADALAVIPSSDGASLDAARSLDNIDANTKAIDANTQKAK